MSCRPAFVLALLVAVACFRRGTVDGGDPLDALLRAADAAWDGGGADRHRRVEDLLSQAARLAPTSPKVQWRQARLLVGRGMAASDPEDALQLYGAGRAAALGCLDGEAVFRRGRRTGAWRDAVAGITDERTDCVLWGAWAWTRWFATQGGAAAAIDLDAIDVLVGASPTDGPRASAVHDWMRGVLAATRPHGDLAEARSLLTEDLARANPTRRADLVLWVGLPSGDRELVSEQVAAIRELAGEGPEDRGAVARVEGLR